MSSRPEKPIITKPLEPKVKDGVIEAVDPPEEPLTMTPDAAEITGIRLLDAAGKARGE